MNPEEMAKLLEALKAGDEETIETLACAHFITSEGRCNWTNIVAFEGFSGCHISALEKDSFGWLIGGIKYEGKVYSYG